MIFLFFLLNFFSPLFQSELPVFPSPFCGARILPVSQPRITVFPNICSSYPLPSFSERGANRPVPLLHFRPPSLPHLVYWISTPFLPRTPSGGVQMYIVLRLGALVNLGEGSCLAETCFPKGDIRLTLSSSFQWSFSPTGLDFSPIKF